MQDGLVEHLGHAFDRDAVGQRAAVRGAPPQEAAQHIVYGVGLLLEFQFAVDVDEARTDVFEVEVDAFAQCREKMIFPDT